MTNEHMVERELHRLRRGAHIEPFRCSTSFMDNITVLDQQRWQSPAAVTCENGTSPGLCHRGFRIKLSCCRTRKANDLCIHRTEAQRPKFVGSREEVGRLAGDTVPSVWTRNRPRRDSLCRVQGKCFNQARTRLADTVGEVARVSRQFCRFVIRSTSTHSIPKPEGSNEVTKRPSINSWMDVAVARPRCHDSTASNGADKRSTRQMPRCWPTEASE